MAVVSSVGTPAVLSRPSYSAGPFHREAISLCRSQPTVLCAKKSKSDCQTSSCSGEGSATSQRRQALIQILFSALGLPSIVGSASAETDLQNFRTYEDDSNKFRILVPQDWLVGSGETTGIRSVTAFYPGEASDTNEAFFSQHCDHGSWSGFYQIRVFWYCRCFCRKPGEWIG
uniref:PsbP domain-containing protein 3, chloroplastic n=1 Tax=Anthurium amnicola TaxID=1678845 RepID=A0A1D1YYA4_9ARAE